MQIQRVGKSTHIALRISDAIEIIRSRSYVLLLDRWWSSQVIDVRCLLGRKLSSSSFSQVLISATSGMAATGDITVSDYVRSR